MGRSGRKAGFYLLPPQFRNGAESFG
jgi:hypothetical protein